MLRLEKTRHVVKIGPMHLKGVWIPFDRALDIANEEKITELLYPLFVHDIGALLYHPTNQACQSIDSAAIAAWRKFDTQEPTLTHQYPTGHAGATGTRSQNTSSTPFSNRLNDALGAYPTVTSAGPSTTLPETNDPEFDSWLQQLHHHHLPNQYPPSKQPRMGYPSKSSSTMEDHGPPSVVGQPGMPNPAPRPKGPKLKFPTEDDTLLVELKETKHLTWKQIADFFPGRTSGTLQVRYRTKLRAKSTNWTDDMVRKGDTAV